MRIKQLWAVVPLPSKLSLAYSRVTLNLPSTVFFVLAFLQCLFQVSLHIWLYTQHNSAGQDIEAVALNSTIVTSPLVVRTGNDLFLCKDIPTLVGGPDKCIKAQNLTVTSKRSLAVIPKFDTSGNLINVEFPDSNTRVVTARCVEVLPWVFQSLRATNREDLNFFAYHVWLFGVSLTAILYGSIPHLIAALASQAFCVLGSGFRIMETAGFQSDFNRMVVDGSCDGVDLLGAAYFQLRLPVEVRSLRRGAAGSCG